MKQLYINVPNNIHAWFSSPLQYIVTTLTLGSQPKQGFARLQAKGEAGSHTTYSQECEKVWGNEPSHPKGVPLWELESRWTPVSSKGNYRGQNSMVWGAFYINGNFLERRYLKWARIPHLNIWNTSYGQKKGRESNWQFDSRPLKVRNRLDFHMCRWRVTYRSKYLDKGYNFASDLISIEGLHIKLWRLKVTGVPTLAISRLPLGSSETKSHLDVGPVERCKIYYKGEGGGFPQVRVVVSFVCLCCPWFTWATDVQMANAKPFLISTLQDLSNDTKNTPMRGVLGLAVELWTFGSPRGLQILTFSKCWASPPHLAKVGLRQTKFQKEVRLGSRRDELAKEMKQNIQKGIKSHFHLRNWLLCYKQNQFYVPKGRLRDVLLRECHDGPLASHGGAKRTTTFLKKSYYWPNLKEDAEEYVKTYLTCQQNRVLNKKQAGLLRPLPIPKGPWESVSMDFMVSLPPLKGFDAIMVVVDRFSKMAYFIPTKESATT